MFISASYENRNGTNYYKIIYISKSTSYELKKKMEQIMIRSYICLHQHLMKTEIEQIIIRSYIFLNQHLMSLKKMEQIIIRSYNYTAYNQSNQLERPHVLCKNSG
jgi:hypothetical protein